MRIFKSLTLNGTFLVSVCLPISAGAQTATQAQSDGASEKASAYYHFTLGHLYSELAGAYGNRGEYLTRAIENYREAMKADPNASFLAEELSDLYIQAGRLKEAVAETEEILKRNPNDTNARRILGRIYTRMIGDSQQNRVNETMLRRAIEQYEKLSELQPKDVDSLLMLGRLQKVAQNSVEAEKAYKKALDVEPENEDALTGLAIVYADLGDSKRASELLAAVAARSPSLRTLTALAGQYEQMRDYALAAETLRRAADMSPGNVEIKRAYAQNLVLAEQYDEALKVYTEVAREAPKDPVAPLRISQIYRQKRQYDQAREWGQKALKADPEGLESQYNLVNILEAEGKTGQAIAAMKKLVDSTAKKSYSDGERNNRVILLEAYGRMLRDNDQPTEAVAVFRQIGELQPDRADRAVAQISDTLRRSKRYDEALAEADAALAKQKESRVLRAVRSSVLADMGRADEAAADVRKLLDGKNDRETYITLAQIYEKGKNYEKMAEAITEAENLSTTDEERQAIAFMRAAMLEKTKRYDDAEREFRKLIAADPDNASALNYLGYMLADRNVKVSEALEFIKKAVQIEPENGAYLDSLGWAYYRLGDLENAERYLVQAIERFSKDPTVHDHLGDVYFKMGRLKDAIEHWQISIREWNNAAPADQDTSEMAKVQKKMESARIRLAKENGSGVPRP
jgi:tetratricopeptide (TPR) repeat protein